MTNGPIVGLRVAVGSARGRSRRPDRRAGGSIPADFTSGGSALGAGARPAPSCAKAFASSTASSCPCPTEASEDPPKRKNGHERLLPERARDARRRLVRAPEIGLAGDTDHAREIHVAARRKADVPPREVVPACGTRRNRHRRIPAAPSRAVPCGQAPASGKPATACATSCRCWRTVAVATSRPKRRRPAGS